MSTPFPAPTPGPLIADRDAKKHPLRALLLAAGALGLLIWLCYEPSLAFRFINLDDGSHITKNPMIQGGLTLDGVKRAFTEHHAALWIPLTWISLMCDVSLFGMDPTGMRAVNLLWHWAAAVLILVWLFEATGLFWRALAVATLFAVHPINVESVVWLTERKNVLCMAFIALALVFYGRHVRRPSGMRLGSCLGAFMLALLAKPMAVTLPAVLILLDFWPYRRWTKAAAGRLLLEKIPFFALTAAACVLALRAPEAMPDPENSAGAVPFELLGMPERISNALVSYAAYVRQLFWPTDLALPYYHPLVVQTVPMILSLAFLATITGVLIRQHKRLPWGLVGWLWFLGALVPSIGFIQVGQQARADRFTYFPQVGFWIAVVWTVSMLMGRFPKALHGALAGIVLMLSIWMTRVQVGYWQDSVTLFERTMQLAGNDPVAVNVAANNCVRAAEFEKAEVYYKRSIQLNPKDPDVWSDLGIVLARLGKDNEAVLAFTMANRLEPQEAGHQGNLGRAYERLNMPAKAGAAYRKALEIRPGFAQVHFRLGLFLEKTSPAEALAHLKKAADLDPGNAEFREALARFQKN